jgi:hypothetical protein
MRFRESEGAAAKPGTIELHIIQPGWGSSGYYGEAKLRKACEAGVYPKGMLMHMDHPTRKQEADNPARSTETLAAVLAEAGHYETDGWDGPGIYSTADIRPHRREDLKWLSGKIGVSHYVDGIAEDGTAPDGKKGRIITELRASPFNSVDFVTIPGAGGHSRSIAEVLKESQSNNQRKNMAEGNQETLTLSEIRTKFPEVVTELKEQLMKELKIESLNESQKKELKEAKDKSDNLEKQLKEARAKIAEGAARTFVAAEVAKAKLTETASKTLTESLIKAVPLAEDGSIDAVKFGVTVTEAIKEKKAEIDAILKESGRSGVHDNGGSFGAGTDAEVKKAREDLAESYVANGKTREEANRLAGIKEA